MILAANQHDLLAGEGLRDKIAGYFLKSDQSYIDLTGIEQLTQLVAVGNTEGNAYMGKRTVKTGDDVLHHDVGSAVGDANGNLAPQIAGNILHQSGTVAHSAQHLLGGMYKYLAGIGELQFIGYPFEQRQADFFFYGQKLAVQGGAGDEQSAGGFGDAFVLSNGNDIGKGFSVHEYPRFQ